MKDRLIVTPSEVRAIRIAAGLTQKEAADRIGVDERTWQRWELGEVKRIWRVRVDPIVALTKRQARHRNA